MKKAVAFLITLSFLVRTAQASGWKMEVVDQYSLSSDTTAFPLTIHKTPNGHIWISGVAMNDQNDLVGSGIIRVSRDQGKTWRHHATLPGFFLTDLVVLPNGKLIGTGNIGGDDSSFDSLVWQTIEINGSRSYRKLDEYRIEENGASGANRIFYSSSGRELFVAGFAADGPEQKPATQYSWTVRSSRDGGKSWRISDDFPGWETVESASITAIVEDDRGGIYVGGWWSREKSRSVGATVRRKIERSSTWGLSRFYQPPPNQRALGRLLFTDDAKKVIHHGGIEGSNHPKCFLESSRDYGRTWNRNTSFSPPKDLKCDIFGGTQSENTMVLAGRVDTRKSQNTSQGATWISEDGGKSWLEPIIADGPLGPGPFQLYAARLLSPDEALLAGSYLEEESHTAQTQSSSRSKKFKKTWFVFRLYRAPQRKQE